MSHLPTLNHGIDPVPAEPSVLTGEAGVWLASLPTPVRVHGVAAHAPDIANQLAAVWNDAPSTAALLEQLLVDCGMRSLSPMVASELLRLYEYHARYRTTDAPDTTWELPMPRLPGLQPTAALGRSQA